MSGAIFNAVVIVISGSSIGIIALGLMNDRRILISGLALALISTVALYSQHYSTARIFLHIFLIAVLSILTTVISKKYLTSKT